MVIFVPVSCSIFLRLRPSLPMSLPTRLLCARIFKGTSSALKWILKNQNQRSSQSGNTEISSHRY